jgi:hypothetical protein
MVAVAEALGVPPPLVPATAVEEGQTAVGATAPQSAPEPARAAETWWWSWMKTRHLPHCRGVALS